MTKEVLEEIVKAIVDNPEQVKVSEIDGDQTVILEVRVAENDLGKVIGRKGRTITAIRSLLSSIGGKNSKRYVLELVE
ncbi:KH domain-containing protein [bacterium]|nr:KH domain-containing protein [bacterium]